MFDVVTNLDLLEDIDPQRLCVVEPSPKFPTELLWEAIDHQAFYRRYQDWISRHLILNQPLAIRDFVKQLENDGWTVIFLESCLPVLEAYERWELPLHIDGFILPNDGTLYPYQEWSLHRALSQDCYFFGWAPGTGKSIAATAGAQELFNRNRIDLVLAFTLMKLKHNMARFFTTTTQLHAVVNDGTPEKRQRLYSEGTEVFVLNYEKATFDYDQLLELVKTHRTLFVLDECQKVLTDGKSTSARKHLDKLIRQAREPMVWPMSATVVSHSPFRYRDVFSLGNVANPLGSKADFESRYCKSKKVYRIPTRNGRSFPHTVWDWDLPKLHEVRHRVADVAHNVRKTDAGVRENFKGLQNVVIPVQMSEEDRKLYEVIQDSAQQALEQDQNLGPYYRILRYVCNNPESLLHTEDVVGLEILRDHRAAVTAAHCAKLEMFLDNVEAIRDSGDRCICFTQWTHLSLFLLRDHLERRKIKHVMHYGVGQSARESQAAQEQFKSDPSITVFLSSDAGAYGLNMQECRYVINYEVPYSYDVWLQRINRIDRIDSYLDGLTAYNYITEDSVEERIWKILNQRRELAAATLGTNEVLEYGSETDQKTLQYLIFGER